MGSAWGDGREVKGTNKYTFSYLVFVPLERALSSGFSNVVLRGLCHLRECGFPILVTILKTSCSVIPRLRDHLLNQHGWRPALLCSDGLTGHLVPSPED